MRITALNPTTMVEGLRSLITRGANVESFAFQGFKRLQQLARKKWSLSFLTKCLIGIEQRL